MCWEGHWVGVRGLHPRPRSPANQLHVLGSRAGPLLLGGCGNGGRGSCGRRMLSYPENRISLDRHCSLQTFNKSFFGGAACSLLCMGFLYLQWAGVTLCCDAQAFTAEPSLVAEYRL